MSPALCVCVCVGYRSAGTKSSKVTEASPTWGSITILWLPTISSSCTGSRAISSLSWLISCLWLPSDMICLAVSPPGYRAERNMEKAITSAKSSAASGSPQLPPSWQADHQWPELLTFQLVIRALSFNHRPLSLFPPLFQPLFFPWNFLVQTIHLKVEAVLLVMWFGSLFG